MMLVERDMLLVENDIIVAGHDMMLLDYARTPRLGMQKIPIFAIIPFFTQIPFFYPNL